MSSSFVNPFARKSKIGYPESVARLKEEARRHLDLTEEVTISVTELNCSDRDCPDTETVVAVLINGEKPRLARIHKPIPEVTLKDLVKAFGGDQDDLT
ncbi:hypothetical protein ACVW1C_002245 [Bradyrhizobium sp. USDA 4011]